MKKVPTNLWWRMSRTKRNLGAGFIDMVSVTVSKKSSSRREDNSWQEMFLPQSRLGGHSPGVGIWLSVFLGLVITAAFLTIGARLWELEVAHGQENTLLSEGNRVRIRVIPAPRGLIYDREGQILATNTPGFRLVAEASGLKGSRLKEIADYLATMTGKPAAEVAAAISGSKQPEALIDSGMSRDRAISFELKLKDFPEVRVVEEPIRSYPNKEVLAHLLGYLGEINANELALPKYSGYSAGVKIGRSGIEAAYEFLLRGKDGRELVEVDSLGRAERVIARQDPIPGMSLTLTVDLNLTKSMEALLVKELATAKSSKGAVVAVNPEDGSILAYISYPGFDPNLFSRGISSSQYAKLTNDSNQPLFDRVIGGVYPPGSTFKPTVAVAALSSGVTTKDRLIESPGAITLGTQTFRNWRPQGLGLQNIVEAIGWSNDIYFYRMGGELGIDRLSSWAGKFGFGEKTGIKLLGESAGNLPTADWKEKTYGEIWYPGDSYNLGIGQGYLLVTPLQLVMDVSAIGNGGNLYQPILIKEVRGPDDVLLSRDYAKLRRGNLAPSEALATTKEGMKKACTIFVQFDGDIGCKTGTAEIGESTNPHAWFAAFAPLEKPEIALVVLIEQGGHGSIVSSPVARPALEKYLKK